MTRNRRPYAGPDKHEYFDPKKYFAFCGERCSFRTGANEPCVFQRQRTLWAAQLWAAVGVVTLTKVKHRRELLFASLPILFAIHQFIEGFVWLGLDGILPPTVTHDMGAAFMLYAQGLLPFLLPLSVLLFEPDGEGPPADAAVPCDRHGKRRSIFCGRSPRIPRRCT